MSNSDSVSALAGRSTGGSANPSQLIRFLNDPKDFSGSSSDSVSPLTWLKKLNRIKDLAALSDREILLIASDHLVGRAEAWFDVTCDSVTTWSAFTTLFKKKYCSGMKNVWRTQIKNLKQSPDESCEDVAVKLRELYSLINNNDEASMIHTFLDAIDPSVAREVEASVMSDNSTLEEVVSAASQLEAVNLKYKMKASYVVTESQVAAGSVVSGISRGETLNSGAMNAARSTYSENSDDTISNLLKEFRELKVSLVNNNRPQYAPGPRNSQPATRTFTCFQCGEEGHRKTDCPKLASARLTGSNAIPIDESGKGLDRRL